MPFTIVMHNDSGELDREAAADECGIKAAIQRIVDDVEDSWRDGDSITVFKISETDAKNQQFWDEFQAKLRR